jgi:hypothetical protein
LPAELYVTSDFCSPLPQCKQLFVKKLIKLEVGNLNEVKPNERVVKCSEVYLDEV